MKKLLCLFLIICTVFCVSGCQTKWSDLPENNIVTQPLKNIFASARTIIAGQPVENVCNLSNTYYNLTQEKSLNVAYFGSEATTKASDGDSWCTLTTNWFKSTFPDAQIIETNVTSGVSNSYWGYFVLDETVIAQNPNLVFLEFAVSDFTADFSVDQSIANMEGIIIKIRKALPKTDIVVVLSTNAANLGAEYRTLTAHKKLADYYGIPYIDVSETLSSKINGPDQIYSYFVKKSGNLNGKGHEICSNSIAKFLNEHLVTSPQNVTTLTDHKMPTGDYISNVSKSLKIIYAQDLENTPGWELNASKSNAISFMGKTLYGSGDSVLNIEFEGTGLGMVMALERSISLKIIVDNSKPIYIDVEYFDPNQIPLLDNLIPKKHNVKIEFLNGNKIIVGGFLISE